MNVKERIEAKCSNFAHRVFYRLFCDGNDSFVHELRDSANVLENLGKMLESNQMFGDYNTSDLFDHIERELSKLSMRVESFKKMTAENAAAFNELHELIED